VGGVMIAALWPMRITDAHADSAEAGYRRL